MGVAPTSAADKLFVRLDLIRTLFDEACSTIILRNQKMSMAGRQVQLVTTDPPHYTPS